MRAAIVLCAVSVLACGSTPATGPDPQPPAVPIAAVSAAPESEPPELEANGESPASSATADKPWIPGKRVVARGRVSDEPWQHLIGSVPGKQPDYFDLEAGGQTVIYSASPIRCPGLVEVEGTVKEVRGTPKRPGGPETKVDDSYGELHIDVDGYRCR